MSIPARLLKAISKPDTVVYKNVIHYDQAGVPQELGNDLTFPNPYKNAINVIQHIIN